MQFVFEQVRVGGDRNFGYLIGDRAAQEGVLVDPSYQPELLCERARVQSLKITHILNTHGHPDHTNGNDKAAGITGSPIAAHSQAIPAGDIALEDDEVLEVGELTLRCLHTPGHAADHLVMYVKEAELALTGDLIFVGKVGGTGNEESARQEWESLRRVMRELPDSATLWPGHDYGCRPSSTVGLERMTNPFLACQDLEEFLELKVRWASYKTRLGLR